MSKKEGYSRPGLFGGQQRNLRRLESLRRLIENTCTVLLTADPQQRICRLLI